MTDERRTRGVHYTPAPVARYLAELAVLPWLEAQGNAAQSLSVLDPTCGDGALLAAVGAVFATWQRSRTGPPPLRLRLCGLDISEAAVKRTRERLASVTDTTHELAAGDALTDHPLLAQRFDIVIGNPPYVFGEHLGPVDRDALAKRYALGRGRQPDLFKLFYERTLELLAEQGRHAFLVPDALLARDEHADLRRLIVEQLNVDHVCQLGRVFASAAGVASAVVAGSKEAHAPEVVIDRWHGDGITPSHALPRTWLMPADGESWSIDAPATWFGPTGLRAQLERPGLRLADMLTPGRLGLTRGEELGKSSLERHTTATRSAWGERPHDGRIPIYAGESVHRHWLGPPTRETQRTRIDKDPSYYAGPKILFVKTGAGPVAASSDDDLPVLQSVYTLHLADDVRKRVDEDAVVAVLCSALLATYSWHRWTFGKRLQPQFTIDNVRRLPMPPLDALTAASADLSRAVNRIRSALVGGREAIEVERALDARVAELFGLEFEDVQPVVEAALARLPPSQRSRWCTTPPRN